MTSRKHLMVLLSQGESTVKGSVNSMKYVTDLSVNHIRIIPTRTSVGAASEERRDEKKNGAAHPH